MRKFAIAGIALSLAACGDLPKADPAVVAKINYVCAYSGMFEFASKAALSVVPVAGAAASTALDAGVDYACLHPEMVAQGEETVVALINKFKALGKM